MTVRDGRPVDNDDSTADHGTRLLDDTGAPHAYGAVLASDSQDTGSTSAPRPTRPDEEELAREALDDTDMSRPTRHLAIAYAGLLLLAFTTSLEGQVTAPLAAFAVSSFNNHSLLSTVYVVQGVVNAVIKPPMAKMADVFGRLEAFTVAILFCVAGYVQMASSHSIRTFSAAQILYSAGITGLQVLQQILVADTSDLRHRALLSSLPDTPFLVTVWIGPSIAAAVLATTSWRWGYAMWAILLPLAFCPLAGSLALNAYQTHRSHRQGRLARGCLGLTAVSGPATSSPTGSAVSTNWTTSKASSALRRLLTDLDAVGILLLSAALSLILLPLTLSRSLAGGWSNPLLGLSVIAGLLLLIFAFPAWEARPHLAPHPLIPLALLRNVTFCAGCGVGLFFFAVFYLSVQPYFYSYLLVAHNQEIATAGRITQIFSFTSTICAVSASIAIRHVRRYKPFVVAGATVYLVGVACMLRHRTADAGTIRLVATQIAVGSGAGLMSVPTQIGIQASVAHMPHLVSAATAVYLTMGEVGIAIGSAISGAIWGRLVPAKLELYLPSADRQNASAIYSSVSVALSYPWGSPTRDAIIRAYQESMTALLYVAVGFCVPVLLLALLMRDYRLDGGNEAAGSSSDAGDDAVEAEPLTPVAVSAGAHGGSFATADERVNLLSEEAVNEVEDE
ncbi:siderochrome-iron transporter [Grosmannia clavigera kw1407]|uniref:Siderochrome-iron transporter n=1 Tax=Grosmannia clavigera (strain kw1407 / UAMH 11150) TaxID=655863 RepID=F0XS68_GROCL|nr:siderochrome-iron transporter [Grosmannia clavigera kw1407]EFW99451.1 siderochrome-iron transporter [Grosmannia clavigera kw1407]